MRGLAMAGAATASEITLRMPEISDTKELARICFEAFGAIQDHHRFERDLPVIDAAEQLIGAWISHPSVWGILAERDGRILGSNFLDERDPIRGVGPITIDPAGQNAGVGRLLMQAAMQRGEGAPGIRLLQDAFHMRSLCLYASLGFDVKDPVGVMTGEPRSGAVPGVEVRPLTESDLDECEALCKRVHGFERTNELRDAIHGLAPFVAQRARRIVGYATTIDAPLAFLVPLRSGLFRWGLGERLRLAKPMTLMAMGEYQEPRGGWF